MPSVSVLLPVFNAEKTLDTTLRSLIRQHNIQWECVLIDDGSTDASLEIAHRFADEEPRIRVVARPHEGLIPSLIAGTPLCRGDLIARMDADDWMHRNRLGLQSAALKRHPEWQAVGCGVRLFPRRSMRDGRRAYERWLNGLSDPETVWRNRFIECPVAHPTLMIRRSALLDLGYRDRGWPEDYDLLLRLLRRGPCVGMVPERLLGWRDSPARLSRTDQHYALERFTECRAWHLSQDFLKGHDQYVLWGHGRTGRALRRALAIHGHQPKRIVEVHPRRIGNFIHGALVIEPADLAHLPKEKIIVSVAGAGPREEIRATLEEIQFEEGTDYVFAA